MDTTKSIPVRIAWIVVAVAILVIAVLIPTPEGLTEGGKMSIALIVAGIVLWVTEPIDMAISAICLMVLMPFFHVYDSTQLIWTNFISSVIFFVLASFGFASRDACAREFEGYRVCIYGRHRSGVCFCV